MLHHPTTLHLIDLENNQNHEIGQLWLFLKIITFWDRSDSVVFRGFQWKSRSPSNSASNFTWDSVLISNFPNFDFGCSLYEPVNYYLNFNEPKIEHRPLPLEVYMMFIKKLCKSFVYLVDRGNFEEFKKILRKLLRKFWTNFDKRKW